MAAGFFVTGIALPRASAARNLRWIPAVDWRSSQPACGSVAVKEERKPVLSAAADFFRGQEHSLPWESVVGILCRSPVNSKRWRLRISHKRIALYRSSQTKLSFVSCTSTCVIANFSSCITFEKTKEGRRRIFYKNI